MAQLLTVTNTPVGTYPGSGTGPPAPVIQPDSRDDSMLIILGTGTVPAAGLLCTINLGSAYSQNVTGQPAQGGAPPPYTSIDVPILKAWLSPIGAVAKNADVYLTNAITPNQLNVAVKNAPAASLAATLAAGLVFAVFFDG
jgi:hypothetical protein